MSLFRPNIDAIEGYTPGEQPQEDGWTKLNTNENPYPPSPRVVVALEDAAAGRLQIYPDPLARRFCEVAGELFGVDADWILPANGSDENLTILMRTFVDPGELVSFPYPSYVLYETLADIQAAAHERFRLNPDFTWDWDRTTPIVERSKLCFVPNPNSPSGNRWPDEDLAKLIPPNGLMVLDEAYGDFCDEPHAADFIKHADADSPRRRVVVTRTLSKSYSLAGLRFGFAIAHPDWIRGMRKVKDSYNCDTLSLAGAAAALEDQAWMNANRSRILATRARLTESLTNLGWEVIPSQANFVWTTHKAMSHRKTYEELKRQKILVRYMNFPDATTEGDTVDGLRITIGTDAQIDRLLEAMAAI